MRSYKVDKTVPYDMVLCLGMMETEAHHYLQVLPAHTIFPQVFEQTSFKVMGLMKLYLTYHNLISKIFSFQLGPS